MSAAPSGVPAPAPNSCPPSPRSASFPRVSGLDPELAKQADAYRRRLETPPPRHDVPALVKSATAERDTLLKAAAQLLTDATHPKALFYSVNFFGFARNKATGWDLGPFLLTTDGVPFAPGDRHDENSEEHRLQIGAPAGTQMFRMRTWDPLPVAPPRSIVDGRETFLATTEGRAEIWHDTYDYRWALLADWLNDQLGSMLRT